ESLFKGLRSLEAVKPLRLEDVPDDELQRKLARPNSQRFSYITYALEHDWSIDEIYRLSRIDPWFLDQLKQVMEIQREVESVPAVSEPGAVAMGSNRSIGISDPVATARGSDTRPPVLENIPFDLLRAFKEAALSDRRLAYLTKRSEDEVRAYRKQLGLIPVFKRVDTCGAEFESFTPYLYSTYEEEDEAAVTGRQKVIILGSGPNRIGQGIEFDYCCCHASFALSEEGFESIMVNCNPETVSTDYDTSDRLYFEPLDEEAVLAVLEREQPVGVCIQFGGQTPLKLARTVERAGYRILGTPFDAVDLAEDRQRFGGVMEHVEEAGVHSGDSSCVLPAHSLGSAQEQEIRAIVERLAPALGVVGLINVQLAVVGEDVYVLEANPRASRTVPFASKAIGVNLVEAACRLTAGARVSELVLPRRRAGRPRRGPVSVKAAVLPFAR